MYCLLNNRVHNLICLFLFLLFVGIIREGRPGTCPECRQSIALDSCRRVYFNFVGEEDNMQQYIDHLDNQYKAQINRYEEMKVKHALELRRKNEALDRMKKKAEKYKKKLRELPLYPKQCECSRPM